MYTLNIDKNSTNILLVDSTLGDNELKNIKSSFKKIITFDLESDRNLISKNFLHEISDTCIDNPELKIIDSACLNFCQWYNENNGDEILSYQDVNLGSLFRVEFHNFLIPLLKIFLTLKKLKNLYPDHVFHCSQQLHKISKELGFNSIPLNDKSPDIELTWDKVQFNLTRSISMKISKKNYNKIKNFSKIITDLVIKKNYDKNLQNNFGFIEFDPIKYEKIFQESNNFKQTFHLYNRHRPIFYNTKSLKIIKNSKILPFIPSKDSLKTDEKLINNSCKIILDNFYKFLNNVNFNSFFKLFEIEFWSFLKPILIKIFENKISESIYEIEYAKSFLLENKIKSVIILSESGFTEQIITKLAKNFSINVILLQHGIIVDNPSAFNYNKIIGGVLPIESDYFFSWGKISFGYIRQLDSVNSEIKLIGNSNLDRILSKNKQQQKISNNILLLATGPRNQQSVGHHVHVWNEYEKTIKSIYSSISNSNLNLIIKRHPDVAENDFSSEFYSHFSDVKIFKNGDLSELLNDSKLVISLGVSSGILESQILEKPVISIDAEYDVFGSTDYIPNSCLHLPIEKFENFLSKILAEPDKFDELMQKGKNSIYDNISNIGKSSQIMFDTLIKL